MNISAPTVALVLGVAIPLVHAALTKPFLPPVAKTVVALILAGGAAVLAQVAGVHGSFSLNALVETFVLAAAAAGGSRISLTNGPVLDAVTAATSGIGVGPATASPGQGTTP